MSLKCNTCQNSLSGGEVICCPHCGEFICEGCARANAMLCPHCFTDVYPNS